MIRRLAAFACFVVAWGVLSACPGVAAEKPYVQTYPHVSLAIDYQVDPQWPQRPEGLEWGAMPAVSIDAKNQVWVFTRGTPPVQVYSADGKFVRGWGDEIKGAAHGLRFDRDGNVWVTDARDHVVMQFTPEGKLLRTLGTRGEAGCDESHFNKPTDTAITPAGDVFVADGYGNGRVVHFDRNGKFVKAWGKSGTGPGEFSIVHSIVVDSKGRLYVADRNNVRIQVFTQDGKFVEQWRDLMVPWGLTITKDDEIWACGSSPMAWREEDACLGCPPKDQIALRLSTSGKVLQIVGFPLAKDPAALKPGELNWLHTIAVDSQGNLYVGDIMGKRVQKFWKKEGVK